MLRAGKGKLISFATVVLLTQPANAVTTGNELHTYCTEPDLSRDCFGFILGAIEGIAYASAASGTSGKIICMTPFGVTNGQAVDVVKKWLADKPNTRHELAAVLVARAINAAWPCKAR